MPPPPLFQSLAYHTLVMNEDDEDETDTEEEEEEEKDSSRMKRSPDKTNNGNTASSNAVANIKASVSSSPTLTKKKTKRKKKRTKNKKKSDSSNDNDTHQAAVAKTVRFGGVSVREYERCLGCDVVPVDGGWPLGMGCTVSDEYRIHGGIEGFEERRQVELRQRWLQIVSSSERREKQNNKDGAEIHHLRPPMVPPTGVLETRQFDYKKIPCEITGSTKNPLFRPLSEDQRMHLLVSESNETDHPVNSTSSELSPRSPPRSNSLKQQRRQRSKSEQFSPKDSPKPISRTTTRRLRSNSDQYYNKTFTSTDVLHARNELEQVRVHRSMEGSTGCSCRKLDVYIPPKDGGRKAQHRRMNERKVKEELRKRGLLPDKNQSSTTSRAELEQLLHDAVEKEPCCWSDDCVCVRNGLGCQADACSCWHDSHQRKGHSASDTVGEGGLSIPEIQARCGNGMYVVDLDGISAFRKQFCQTTAT